MSWLFLINVFYRGVAEEQNGIGEMIGGVMIANLFSATYLGLSASAPITINGSAHHSGNGQKTSAQKRVHPFGKSFRHELSIGPGVEDARRTCKIGKAELATGDAVESTPAYDDNGISQIRVYCKLK